MTFLFKKFFNWCLIFWIFLKKINYYTIFLLMFVFLFALLFSYLVHQFKDNFTCHFWKPLKNLFSRHYNFLSRSINHFSLFFLFILSPNSIACTAGHQKLILCCMTREQRGTKYGLFVHERRRQFLRPCQKVPCHFDRISHPRKLSKHPERISLRRARSSWLRPRRKLLRHQLWPRHRENPR